MRKGFTLIEMLVTIVIISVITGLSVAAFKGYKQRTYFNDAVSQVNSEVLKAQSLALAPGEEDVTGYTLTFESPGSYTIVQVGGENNGNVVDSGTAKGITLSGDLSFTFNKDGSANPGTLTISAAGYDPKQVVVTPAGSVELK